MKIKLHIAIMAALLIPLLGHGQYSVISSWNPGATETNYATVYRPEPILLVHGYASKDLLIHKEPEEKT